MEYSCRISLSRGVCQRMVRVISPSHSWNVCMYCIFTLIVRVSHCSVYKIGHLNALFLLSWLCLFVGSRTVARHILSPSSRMPSSRSWTLAHSSFMLTTTTNSVAALLFFPTTIHLYIETVHIYALDFRSSFDLRDPIQGRPTLNEDASDPLGSFLWYQTSINYSENASTCLSHLSVRFQALECDGARLHPLTGYLSKAIDKIPTTLHYPHFPGGIWIELVTECSYVPFYLSCLSS